MTNERLDSIANHVAGFDWAGSDASIQPVFTRDVPDLIAEVQRLRTTVARVREYWSIVFRFVGKCGGIDEVHDAADQIDFGLQECSEIL